MPKQLAFLESNEDRESFFRRVHKFAPEGSADEKLIKKAYKEAKDAFRGVHRQRGERYFEHCRAVAIILMDIVGVTDAQAIAAALLHDIIEDCRRIWGESRLEQEFGPTVLFLVKSVTMPEGEFPNRDSRIALFHAQIVSAAEKDVRVILIKLADRTHNLSTCESLEREKQVRMVEETEVQYLPLAKKHGVLYRELSDLIARRRKTLRKSTAERRKH